MSAPWNWRRRARRLARRLPFDSAGAVLGDLHEEYQARAVRDGRLRTEWWLFRQTWSIARAYAHYDQRGHSVWSRIGGRRGDGLRQTIRSLARSPWYVAAAMAVIALSTALGTVIFAIVDGTLFKPLPYPGASRLFAVSLGYSRLSEPLASMRTVSPATVAEWRAGTTDLTFTAFYIGGLQPVGRHDSVRNADVDQHFFDVLGVRPLLGGFSPEDFSASAPLRSAVVTHKFWRERFGDTPPALGHVLTNEAGAGIRIVGVLPDTFLFPSATRASLTPELITPLVADPSSSASFLRVLARSSPGTDVTASAEQLNAVVVRQAAARPPLNLPADLQARQRIVREGVDRGGLESIDTALRGALRNRARVVFTAAGALVLLACLNVAGLAVARARERQRDLVVRRALGASTRDLIRLMARESLLIVTTGTAIGVLVAWWALPLGAHLFSGDFMLTLKPAVMDWRVAAFAAVVSTSGSLLVILLSAGSVANSGLGRTLSRGGGTTRPVGRWMPMVSVEIAVAYLLMISATLVVGSLLRAWSEDTGFEVPDAAILKVLAPPNSSADDIERLVSDIGKLQGVQAAGGVAHPLLEKAFNGSEFDTPRGAKLSEGGPGGRGGGPGGGGFPIESVPVTQGFFAAAGLAPRAGRLPTSEEFRTGRPLVVVTETVARDYWPDRSALGQVLMHKGRAFEVIGIVNDARFMSLDMEAQGEIFWPIAAMPQPRLSLVMIRFAPGEANGIHTVAATVRERCLNCWVYGSLTLEEALSESIRARRFSAWLFSGFGISALAIVGTGIFGVVAMTTTRRVREIGIRMTLGATPRRVLSQLLCEQIVPVVLGLLAGSVAAWWATTFVASYLYETEPTDAGAWATAAVAILVVASAGVLVPARRASRLDPSRALRVD